LAEVVLGLIFVEAVVLVLFYMLQILISLKVLIQLMLEKVEQADLQLKMLKMG
jgi:hypothetical protein